jgi:hypothetical protein
MFYVNKINWLFGYEGGGEEMLMSDQSSGPPGRRMDIVAGVAPNALKGLVFCNVFEYSRLDFYP